jgi:hypothetical protein
MSWIAKQWEKNYVDEAEAKILETVSIYCPRLSKDCI